MQCVRHLAGSDALQLPLGYTGSSLYILYLYVLVAGPNEGHSFQRINCPLRGNSDTGFCLASPS